MFLAVLFSVSFMCPFHVKCWSNKTLRNLVDSFNCISQLLVLSFDRWTEIAYNSLFAVNQSLIFTSSLFTTVKMCLMSLWLRKILVSSANLTGSNKRDAFSRMLTYTRNRSGPRINLWRTQQVTHLRSVLLFSPMWI